MKDREMVSDSKTRTWDSLPSLWQSPPSTPGRTGTVAQPGLREPAPHWPRPGEGSSLFWPVLVSVGLSQAGGAGCVLTASELPANGVGPPCAAPWRLDKAGIVFWLLCLPSPGLLAGHSPPSRWPGWQEHPGLRTHLLGSTSQALGKEAHLGLCHHSRELGPAPAPPSSPRLQHTLQRPLSPVVREGPLGQPEPSQHPAFPPLPHPTPGQGIPLRPLS